MKDKHLNSFPGTSYSLAAIVRGYLDGHIPLNHSLDEALTRGFNRWEWRAELHRQKLEIDARFRAADERIVNEQFLTINQPVP